MTAFPLSVAAPPATTTATAPPAVTRARSLYTTHLRDVWMRADRMFVWLMSAQWVAGIALALVYSPTAWDGHRDQVHVHVWAAVLLGGAITGVPVSLALRYPGWVVTRHAVAVGQMLTSALLIHLSGGRLETHFHVFGSLAFLAFYRDWRVLLTATLVIAADHVVRGAFWPGSVYGVAYAPIWRSLEHAVWVVFEDVVLVFGSLASLKEMRAIAQRQAELESAQAELVQKRRLEQEMEIAATIQTSILPRDLVVRGLDIAATMIPASEVGGDYYDVLPTADGCWIGIGDVSGHGLKSGLVMLMIQSALASLVRRSPVASPPELLVTLNAVLYENIRHRMRDDNHATLSLLRYSDDGVLRFAGAHEDIVICRTDGRCELIETRGPWLGAMRSVEKHTVETTATLGIGDVMLLHTDGITEAMNGDGEQFGIERLQAALAAVHRAPVLEIKDHVIRAVQEWGAHQEDDITLVVLRRQ